MQICPIHQIELKQLFITSYCPLCVQGEVKEEPEVPFESLPINLQRVAIAKDVLQQLDARKFIATARSFIVFHDYTKEIDEKKPCRVCALGALVISEKVKNKPDNRDLHLIGSTNDRFSIHHILRQFFDSDQLDLMETAFEQSICSLDSSNFYSGSAKYPILAKAREMFRGHLGFTVPEERMRAIMQNIIDNNGTFVVPQ